MFCQRTLLLATCVLIGFQVLSQLPSKISNKHMVSIELGGIGGQGSINYERLLYVREKISLRARIGMGSYRIKDFTNRFNPDIIIPFGFTAYFGKKHMGILGFGQAFSNTVSSNRLANSPERTTSWSANFTIGYGFRKRSSRMTYRIAYTPIFEKYSTFKHWFSLALAYAF